MVRKAFRTRKELYPKDHLLPFFFLFPFHFCLLIWLKVLSTSAMLRAANYLHIIISCLMMQYFLSKNILLISQDSSGQEHEYLQLLLEECHNIVLPSLRKPLSSLIISWKVNFNFSCIIQEGIFDLTYQDSLKLFSWHHL